MAAPRTTRPGRRASRIAIGAACAVGALVGALVLSGCVPAEPDSSPQSNAAPAVAPPAPPAPPAPGGSPTAASTGWVPTGVSLASYSGPSTITANGTVIDGKDIRGSLEIRANNVKITRSRILAGGGDSYALVLQGGYSGLTVTDTEIANLPGQIADRAVASFGTNMTLTRVYVHGTQRGIQTGDGTIVQNSYADDFLNNSQNHATAVMSLGGTHHVLLANNSFGCGTGQCSSAMSVYPQNDFGGANSDWTVSGNLFNGGSYCVYLGYSPNDGESPNTNMRVTNNAFGTKYNAECGEYGPVASWSWSTGNTWTGNHWYAPGTGLDGQAVSAT